MEARESALWNLNRSCSSHCHFPFHLYTNKRIIAVKGRALWAKKRKKKKTSCLIMALQLLPSSNPFGHFKNVTSHPSHPHPAAFHCLVGLQAPAPFLWSWDLRSWWCWKEVSTWCCSQNVLTLFHLKISIYSFIHLLIYYSYWFMNSLADSFICLFMYLFKHAKYRV